MNELYDKENKFGCYAGRDIFFLGKDQHTLLPCYYYADRVVDELNDSPLQFDASYETCNACQDECFRDTSLIFYVKHHPIKLMKKLVTE